MSHETDNAALRGKLLADCAAKDAEIARLKSERHGKTMMDRYEDLRGAESDLDDLIYKLGVAPDWYFDCYDSSVELIGVSPGWRPDGDAGAALHAAGLMVAWVTYADGSATAFNLRLGTSGPCSPRGGGDTRAIVGTLRADVARLKTALIEARSMLVRIHHASRVREEWETGENEADAWRRVSDCLFNWGLDLANNPREYRAALKETK